MSNIFAKIGSASAPIVDPGDPHTVTFGFPITQGEARIRVIDWGDGAHEVMSDGTLRRMTAEEVEAENKLIYLGNSATAGV